MHKTSSFRAVVIQISIILDKLRKALRYLEKQCFRFALYLYQRRIETIYQIIYSQIGSLKNNISHDTYVHVDGERKLHGRNYSLQSIMII